MTSFTGPRRKWAIVLIWLLAGAFTVVWLGKLQGVTAQDVAAFLPKSSEAAKFVHEQKKLSSADSLDVTVSYRRDTSSLTDADKQRIQNDRAHLISHYDLVDADQSPSAYAYDQHGALTKVSIPGIDKDSEKKAQVKIIRDVVGDSSNGLKVYVTGPGAFVADAEDIYTNIDMTLIAATMGIVAIVLLITYRSPLLLLLPIVTVTIADGVASWVIGMLAKHHILVLDGQSAGILPVLVFGVGTDYALLLIARYREELRSHESTYDAMNVAIKRAVPTILASGMTVVVAFLVLLFTELNSDRALGVVGAISIALTVVATCTLLPALILIFGRSVFWPLVPRFGDAPDQGRMWQRTGDFIQRKRIPVTLTTTVILALIAAAGIPQINTNLKQIDFFRSTPDSVAGQKQIEYDFSGGETTPLLLVANARQADQVRTALASVPRVKAAARIDKSHPTANADCVDDPNHPGQCLDLNGKIAMAVILKDDPDTAGERKTVDAVRAAVHAVPGAQAVVGAGGAERLDLARASKHDAIIAVPLVLAVALIIFCLLLRSLVAPLVLMLSVLLSYATALGATVLISKYIFRFPAVEQSVPFLGFVFLVALGIDYCAFLAIRIRELVVGGQDTSSAVVEALRATGTVITSAGAVLAATFAILAVLPIVSVTELGFLVAFGVLLDTFVVRSILVPAIFVWLGETTWWPSRIDSAQQ